jgi:RNA-directed DNA polymerase
VKALQPAERFALASRVHPKNWKDQTPQPVRRVWIPKPGKAEQRPLAIPPMIERCKQAQVKAALEPEWEARFEANSYGFRPGRSCHDAIGAVFLCIEHKPKYVLDADIQGAFDHLNQEKLLEKLQTYPALKHAVKAWLKAGVMEGKEFSPTDSGTPQGGVISPLLMNVALHGMEAMLREGYPLRNAVEKPLFVRYADDFVIFHSNLEHLQEAADRVTTWLQEKGLNLSPKKTRITHTLTPYQGQVGFDFLGFTIRQFPVGKTHSGKSPQGKPLGFKTLIKPSTEAIKRHTTVLREKLTRLRSASQAEVIKVLNPIIWGWAAYYRTVISSQTFNRCDMILWHQLWSWARKRHTNKGKHWIAQRYWHRVEGRNWVFSTPEKAELRMHSTTKIRRHRKVRGTASPYDGNLRYWSQRLKMHPMMHETKAKLLQKQAGKCRWCELHFHEGDLIEIDHITPKSEGGGEELSNKSALHRHCHDARHAKSGKAETLRPLAEAGIHNT